MHIRKILARLIATATLAFGLASASAEAATPASPCSEQRAYRRLDFWLGAWNVFDASGTLVGTADITRILGGCAVQFSWKDPDDSETLELFYYVPALKWWRQVLISDSGRTQERIMPDATGTSEMLQFEGFFKTAAGRTAYNRSTVTRLSADEVHQRIERSLDRKKWETTFDASYKRKAP